MSLRPRAAASSALALLTLLATAAYAADPPTATSTPNGATASPPTPPPSPASVFERITVTATASPHEVSDVAGGVSVVSRDEIEALQMNGARDLLLWEPGVYIANDSTRLGLGGFVVRGIGGNRVQTQIDGIPTAEEFSFGPLAAPRTTLDIDALQSAEIVRGPASSLYGSDALGGVVSLVTRGPGDYLRNGSPYWGTRVGYDGTSDETLASATFARGAGLWKMSLAVQGASGGALHNQGTRDARGASRTTPNPQDRKDFGGLAKLEVA